MNLRSITILFLLSATVLVCYSCERTTVSREYEEIIIESPLKGRGGVHGDPHAFMDMGFDHPDISQMMTMPDGQNDPALQRQLNASVAKPPLSWETPSGWSEEKGGSMRLVTFRSKDGDGNIECSIVSLGGQAGGLKPNIVRWMNQIGIALPPDDQFKDFINTLESVGTQGGFSLKVVDLTDLTNDGQSPSMIAAIGELQDMTIFVKMTGVKAAIVANRDPFLELCRSLRIN